MFYVQDLSAWFWQGPKSIVFAQNKHEVSEGHYGDNITDSRDRVWMCWHQEASLEAEVGAMLRTCQGTGSGSWDAI